MSRPEKGNRPTRAKGGAAMESSDPTTNPTHRTHAVAATDRTIALARFRDDRSPATAHETTTWAQFAREMTAHPKGAKRSRGAVIAGTLDRSRCTNPGTSGHRIGRCLDSLVSRGVGTADLDSGVPHDVPAMIRGALPGVAFFVATTSSATQANPKCRVGVPFSRSVSESEYRNIMSWWLDACALRPHADPVSTRPVQLMYLVTDTGSNYVHSHIEPGGLLDVDAVLAIAPDLAASQCHDEGGGSALEQRREEHETAAPCHCVDDRVARYLADEVGAGHPAMYNLAGDLWEALWRGHSVGPHLGNGRPRWRGRWALRGLVPVGPDRGGQA